MTLSKKDHPGEGRFSDCDIATTEPTAGKRQGTTETNNHMDQTKFQHEPVPAQSPKLAEKLYVKMTDALVRSKLSRNVRAVKLFIKHD